MMREQEKKIKRREKKYILIGRSVHQVEYLDDDPLEGLFGDGW